MDFVSIDFETANEKRNSACALGIAVVKNNEIVEEKYWLIKPYEMRFKPINVWIHGIVEEDVENEPKMDEFWDEIKPYLENNFVIAHNAAFDISVLRKTLDVYGIKYPSFNYSCTMVMSKNYYPDLENYKLNTVAKSLGIEFNHHHAGEDAIAAAKILINLSKDLNVNTIEELSSKLDLRIGKLYEGGYNSAGSLRVNPRQGVFLNNFNSANLAVKVDEAHEIKVNAFLDKTVVFTGPLGSMSRIDAMQIVIRAGGKAGSSVTRKTNYLVTAIRNIEKLTSDKKSNKLKKAEYLIKNGQDIKIISEENFLSML